MFGWVCVGIDLWSIGMVLVVLWERNRETVFGCENCPPLSGCFAGTFYSIRT